MRAKPKLLTPVLVPRVEPSIEWGDYDRIEPGIYPAYCRWAKHYRDPGFKRWTCLLIFDVLSHDLMRVVARVPMWMNLGEEDRPRTGRRSIYFLEWTKANGGAPARRDRLSPQVFVRRMATVEIGDTKKSAAPYSVARKIVSWETGGIQSASQKVKSVNQSSSHTVKEGIDQRQQNSQLSRTE